MTSVHTDLARKYIEYMDLPEEKRGTKWNDFFDWVDIPMEQRSDFLIAAILNRAQKIENDFSQVDNYSTDDDAPYFTDGQ